MSKNKMAEDIEHMTLTELNHKVMHCKLCPRLSKYISEIKKNRATRFVQDSYWAKPVPSFGDPKAKLLIIGLAPAAHGGNRTGRIFTGDSSGDWLISALFETGFANKPTSISKNDGLVLSNVYLTAAVRCAPPFNKPNKDEMYNCSQYLYAETRLLENTTVVILVLGKVAFDAYCKVYNIKGLAFGHNRVYSIHGDKSLIVSYHPSRRNTNTGTLTWQMWIKIFHTAKSIIDRKVRS